MPKLKLKYAPSANLDNLQQAAVCKFAKLKNLKVIAWWRVGLGKTRLALGLLALLRERKKTNGPFICLFIARPAFEYDLRSELQSIGMASTFSTERNGWRLDVDNITIFFCSFASLQKIRSERQTLRRFCGLVIVDELYLFSNPATQRSRRLRAVCEGVDCIGLSGTILPTFDNYALWGQTSALGLEGYIARGSTDFRSRYQTTFSANFGGGQVSLFRPKPGYRKEIFSRLGNQIDVQFPKSLNRTTTKLTYVDLSSEQRSLIKNLVENFYLDLGTIEESYKYVLQTLAKIRSIVNGWVIDKNENCTFLGSPKITALSERLVEIHSAGERCIVWCAFRNDVKVLASQLPFASLQMVGGSKFDVDSWQNRKTNIVLATMGSGSSVNHFASVQFSKFFSLSYKPLDLQQTMGRNDRKYGSCGAHYEFLLGKGSIDEKIYQHLQQSKANETQFIEESKKWLIQLSRSV